MILIPELDTNIIKKRKNIINWNVYVFKNIDKTPTKMGTKLGGGIIKSTVFLMYKPFDNLISKRISTPISKTFLCENVTVTYTT